MRHRHAFVRWLLAIALAVLTLVGCGTVTTTSESGPVTSGTAPTSTSATNGMEHKTPAEVQQAALDALKAANSFHVVGTAPTINSAELGPFDARIQGFSSDTTTVVSGGHLEFLVADNTLYFKADRKGNEAMGTPSDLLDKVSDKWIKAGDANQAPLPSGYTVDTAVAWLRHDPATLLATVGRDIVNGTPVVVVTTQRGDRLYVADTGTPYLLRIFTVGSGQLDFREFGADFHITAPPDASSGILG